MFKLVSTVAFVSALSSTAVFAQSQESGFYIGGHYGQHKVELESDLGDTNAKFGVVGVNAGYQLSPLLGIEARYAQGVDHENVFSGSDAARFEIDRHMALVAKGSIPINQYFSIFGTAGYGETRYSFDYDVLGVAGRTNSTEKGFQYGAGAALNVTNNLSVVAEYTILPKLEDEDEGFYKSDVSLMTLGLNYRF